jgi:hypothetical protein
MQPTAGSAQEESIDLVDRRDEQLELMKQIVDVAKAYSRWLNFVPVGWLSHEYRNTLQLNKEENHEPCSPL